MTDKYSIDLDALMPEPAEITLGGQKILMQPPTVEQVLKISKLSVQFKDIEENQDAIPEAITKMTDIVVEIIPELKGKALNVPQLIGIINLIVKMSNPQQEEATTEDGSKVEIISPNETAA